MRKFTLLKFALGALLILSFFYICLQRTDPDFWWHTQVGNWILTNQSAPHQDIYSYTMPGYQWIDHEWVSNAIFALLFAGGSFVPLSVLFALLISIPLLTYLKRATYQFDLWIILLGASFVALYAGIRQQFITFFLFFILYEILRKRFSGKISKAYFLLPVLFLLWANLHAGFSSGLLLFGMWIAAHHIYAYKKKLFEKTQCIKDALLFTASLLITLINPYGIRLHIEIVKVLLSYETARYIGEWQSGLSFFNPTVIFIIAVFAVTIIKFWKTMQRKPLFIALLFFILFLQSLRHGPLFLIVALPLLHEAAGKAHEEIKTAESGRALSVRAQRTRGLAALLLFFVPLYFFLRVTLDTRYAPQFTPTGAVKFLQREYKKGILGNVFNDYGLGSYLIFAAPEIKVFIDGRMAQWIDENGYSAMKESIRVMEFEKEKNTPPDAWKPVFKKWGIKTALLTPPQTQNAKTNPIQTFLGDRPKLANDLARFLGAEQSHFNLQKTLIAAGWEVTYRDNEAIVLQCKTSCGY